MNRFRDHFFDGATTLFRCLSAVLWAVLLAGPVPAAAQGSAWLRDHYAKQEVLVPMRDGTRLFTAIYSPREGGPYPILLKRTPYGVGPYGKSGFPEEMGPSARFAEEGFIFVYQDVRGRYMSEGDFVNMTPHRPVKVGPLETDESSDTYDTIQWVLTHVKGHNGKVGQWGISYPGFYAAAGMIDAHPALVASSPQAPILDWFEGDDFHRNGALWLPHLFDFIAWFGQPRPKPTPRRVPEFSYGTEDGYSFYLELGPLANVNARYFHGAIPFWNDVMAHGTYDGYWKSRNLRPHLKAVKPAVLVVGGWNDAENLFGSLQLFKTLEKQSPGTRTHLVMGPWHHGGWSNDAGERLGAISFGSRTSDVFQEEVEFPFFMHFLKGGPDPALPRALVFKTGENRWERFDAWPPRATLPVRAYFQAGGRLSFVSPGISEGYDEYLSDPAHPVLAFEDLQITMPREYMTADQRFVAGRADVLTYRTAPLDRDRVVAGPIRVHLNVSTTGTDADWVVKVIDEHPSSEAGGLAGYHQLVRGEVMRGKFRRSLEKPEPFVPGRPTTVEWALNDIFHAFRRGHRLTVQVQSSWFPLMDRNPQVFMDIYGAKAEDFKPARHRLFHSVAGASYIELPMLEP